LAPIELAFKNVIVREFRVQENFVAQRFLRRIEYILAQREGYVILKNIICSLWTVKWLTRSLLIISFSPTRLYVEQISE